MQYTKRIFFREDDRIHYDKLRLLHKKTSLFMMCGSKGTCARGQFQVIAATSAATLLFQAFL